jgi:hypothetical protein
VLGDGEKINFLRDPWLEGQCILDQAPDLYRCCTLRGLTVAQALHEGKWLRHFKRDLPAAALSQFLTIHGRLENVQLQHGVKDSITWKWSSDGQYTATSAYSMQFEGLHMFGFIKPMWRSEAPLKCRIFTWLAALGKCSTADHLEMKRIPHNAACVLCLSHHETALHLLANCNVAIRIWHKVLRAANLPISLAPITTTPKL